MIECHRYHAGQHAGRLGGIGAKDLTWRDDRAAAKRWAEKSGHPLLTMLQFPSGRLIGHFMWIEGAWARASKANFQAVLKGEAWLDQFTRKGAHRAIKKGA